MTYPVHVRLGSLADVEAVARQFAMLWRDDSQEEHMTAAAAILAGNPPSTTPLVILVAEVAGKPVGFVEVGIRSHADGCDPMRPIGFLEGWYVEPEHRRRGIGRTLVVAAEDWARAKGCTEMASDTWLDNEPSQRAHDALGFEVVDRCVHYRKPLQ